MTELQPDGEPPRVLHESNTVSKAAVVTMLLGVSLLAVFAVVAMAGLVHLQGERVADTVKPAPIWKSVETEPPVPNQTIQLHELLAQDRKQLSQYAWVDEQAGIARVPIERAMAIVLEEGLPAGPPTKTDANQADANSATSEEPPEPAVEEEQP